MASPLKPTRVFAWRDELERYIEETGRGTWHEVDEFSEVFVNDICLVSDRGELLIVPRRGKRRLIGGANFYESYSAFRDAIWKQRNQRVIHPLEEGFTTYQDHPSDISALAAHCAELAGASFPGSYSLLVSKADKWLAQQFSAGTAGQLIQEPKKICMLCALAGEAIRERSTTPLVWTVRTFNSIDALGNAVKLYPADLITDDGRICEVSLPLTKQIADPDRSTRSKIIRSFVDFAAKYGFWTV